MQAILNLKTHQKKQKKKEFKNNCACSFHIVWLVFVLIHKNTYKTSKIRYTYTQPKKKTKIAPKIQQTIQSIFFFFVEKIHTLLFVSGVYPPALFLFGYCIFLSLFFVFLFFFWCFFVCVFLVVWFFV